jgi:hypothetical protein
MGAFCYVYTPIPFFTLLSALIKALVTVGDFEQMPWHQKPKKILASP